MTLVSDGPALAAVDEMANAIGVDKTLILIERIGGGRQFFPKNPRPDSLVVRLIGIEDALKLAHLYRGDRPYIPLSKRSLIHCLRTQGLKVTEIARRLRCSERTVFNTIHGGSPARRYLAEDRLDG